jgi:2-dehydro-3-deoxygluconokinase
VHQKRWSTFRSALPTSAGGIFSLGEVILRFDPGEGRIVGARSFRVWEGGGEYNVARGLRRCFSMRTTIATALVGNGIYFLERGFGVRPGTGVMDRGHTAVSQLRPGQIDWDAIFGREGVRWFHTGGIMAALSESSTEVVREAMVAARRHNTIVSFDGNYRPSLWRSRGGRQASIDVNRSLLPMVDVLFGHEGDIASAVEEHAHRPAWHTVESFSAMSQRIIAEFPTLRVVATTVRHTTSANRNGWSAFAFAQDHVDQGLRFDDLEILDRVGGGDSFAAGFIYGLFQRKSLIWSLNCGIAHGALAMTTPGDSSMSTLSEVEGLMGGKLKGTIR